MTIGIYTLGCKVNIYESEYIEDLLTKAGYEIVPFENKADIYIINTCSVTNEADRKSRKIINKSKKQNPQAIIIVMGCYSQVKSQNISANIIIGSKDKSQIVSLIEQYQQKQQTIKQIYNLREEKKFEDMEITKFDNHTRAFIKIQDGCNAFCSYCIIPYTRGQIRSKKPELVIKEVTNLVKNGYKEIVLTGIHTGKYGQDLENTKLEDLLKQLIQIKGLYRIRLSSIEINEITPGIIELLKESNIIASHFHIPIQSGSDKILKLMNRKYDTKYFIEKAQELKKIRSDISLTTDLIVGFPEETDTYFQDTIKTLKQIGFTKIHTFPYSKRENTKASTMPNQIDGLTKKQRVNQILTLSNNLEKKYYTTYQNQILEGISEQRKDGRCIVLTSNYIPIIINEQLPNNQIVKVKITSIDSENNVYGQLIT